MSAPAEYVSQRYVGLQVSTEGVVIVETTLANNTAITPISATEVGVNIPFRVVPLPVLSLLSVMLPFLSIVLVLSR